MKVTVTRGNKTKRVVQGYSWKSLFFGIFYPMFHGDFIQCLLQFVLAIMTCGISWLIVPFKYNENRLDRLIRNGWKIKNDNK